LLPVAAIKSAGAMHGRSDAETRFREEGCSAPRAWVNGPGDTYGRHAHHYHKVLFCQEGSITFHTSDGDIDLAAGDRLDIEPGTEHAATVGPAGCACVEATRA
jgi:mannose-6-phosphate isomerase-like protein (cupin superfamily)